MGIFDKLGFDKKQVANQGQKSPYIQTNTPPKSSAATGNDRVEKLLNEGHSYNVNRQYDRAYVCFNEAYSLGSAIAANMLGNYHLEGKGCQRDMEKAVEFYRFAAERNVSFACFALGKASLYGYGGMDQDLHTALQYFEKALSLGHSWSKARIYWLRDHLEMPQTINLDDSVVRDMLQFLVDENWLDELVLWSYKFCEMGYVDAKVSMALISAGKYGFFRNPQVAKDLLIELADAGNADAYYWLAEVLRHFWIEAGVQTVPEAYRLILDYYNKAKSLGRSDCDRKIIQIERLVREDSLALPFRMTNDLNVDRANLFNTLQQALNDKDYEMQFLVWRVYDGYFGAYFEVAVMPFVAEFHKYGYSHCVKDEIQAQRWYESAIEYNNFEGCYEYGTMLEYSDAVIDVNRAIEVYQMGTDAGDIRCFRRLAILRLYEKHPGMFAIASNADKRTPSVSLTNTEVLDIDKGLEAYANGQYRTAQLHFQSSYDQYKNPSAAFHLGNIYLYGLDCKQDINKAIRYYKAAAELGAGPAYTALGIYTLLGLNKEDENEYETILRFFESACSCEDPDPVGRAMVYWIKYKFGKNPVFDLTEDECDYLLTRLRSFSLIEDWYYYADVFAEHGIKKAKYELAVALLGNYGSYTNRAYSVKHLEELAVENHAGAYYWLANCYRYGWHVNVNSKKAVEYYKLAIQFGYEAEQELQQLKEHIEKGQIRLENVESDNLDELEAKLYDLLISNYFAKNYEVATCVMSLWQQKLSEVQGNILYIFAALNLGGYYFLERDERMAAEWYKGAVEVQQYNNCYDYGLLLECGSDAVFDRKKAEEIYRIGSENGEESCTGRLLAVSYYKECDRYADFTVENLRKSICGRKIKPVVADKATENKTAEHGINTEQQSDEHELPNNLDKYFEDIVGMESVKDQLNRIYNAVKIKLLRDKKLMERGEMPTKNSSGYNFIILGNPGTGKSMVAKMIAKILYDINIRTSDSTAEADRSKLIGAHIGETEQKVTEVMNSADGGTLIIDEAHTLYREESENDFGREAIDALLKEMEERKQSLSVIIAGYKEPMMNMIKNSNSGFASRFAYTIELPDYSDDELIEIAKLFAKEHNCELGTNADAAIRKSIHHDKIDDTFGNARYIRELVNKAIEYQAERLQKAESIEDDDLFTLKAEDFWTGSFEEKGVKEYLAELNALTGLESVKREVNSLINKISVNMEMEKRGLAVSDDFGTLHMAFKGNPGTGKTTVARIIGNLYASMGVLKRGDVFVECSRATLVGQYQGHTAANVKKVVQSAMGGILFVDEAYSLVQSQGDSFGREAVDTLVAEIENNRKNLVVIFAGYSKDMDEFFRNNQGLRSRVPVELIFEDYSEEELFDICNNMFAAKNYHLENEMAKAKLRALIRDKAVRVDFGNARGVRNLVDNIIRKQNVRLAAALQENASQVTNEMLTMITFQDIA